MRALLRVIVSFAVACIGLVLVAPVAAFVVVRALIVGCVHALDRALQEQMNVAEWKDLFEFQPHLGRKLRPNLDVHAPSYAVDLYHLQTCSLGWPGRLEVADADVIVIGDSFAASAGVDAEHAYFRPTDGGPKIKPIACSGFDMVQGYVALKQLPADALRGKFVVWFVCTGNDLVENTWPLVDGWPKPFLASSSSPPTWKLMDSHLRDATETPFEGCLGRVRNARAQLKSTINLYKPGYVADRAYGAAQHLIERATELVHARGGQLVVLTIPYLPRLLPRSMLNRILVAGGGSREVATMDVRYLDERFSQICEKAGVKHVSGADVFSIFDYLFLGDDHWNERGHEKARKLVARLYASHRNAATPRS